MKRGAEEAGLSVQPLAKRVAGGGAGEPVADQDGAAPPPVPAQKIVQWPSVAAAQFGAAPAPESSSPSGGAVGRGDVPATADDKEEGGEDKAAEMDHDADEADDEGDTPAESAALCLEGATKVAPGVFVRGLSEDVMGSRAKFFEAINAFRSESGCAPLPETLECLGTKFDVYDFFRGIIKAGGAREASRKKSWKRVGGEVGVMQEPLKAPNALRTHYNDHLFAFQELLTAKHGLVLPKRPERGPRKPRPTKADAGGGGRAPSAPGSSGTSGARTPDGVEGAPRTRGVREVSPVPDDPPPRGGGGPGDDRMEDLLRVETGDPLRNMIGWARAVARESGRASEEDGGALWGNAQELCSFRLQRYRLASSICRSSRRDRRGVDRFEATFSSDILSFRTMRQQDYPRKESRVGSNYQCRTPGYVLRRPEGGPTEEESVWLQRQVWPPASASGRGRARGPAPAAPSAPRSLAEECGAAAVDLGVGWSMGPGAGEGWSAEEMAGFAAGMREKFKDFGAIRATHVPTKTVGQLVSFYYNVWKARGTAEAVEFYKEREEAKAARDEAKGPAGGGGGRAGGEDRSKRSRTADGTLLPPKVAQQSLAQMLQWVRQLARQAGSRWKGSKPSEFTRIEAGKRVLRTREATMDAAGRLKNVQDYLVMASSMALEGIVGRAAQAPAHRAARFDLGSL